MPTDSTRQPVERLPAYVEDMNFPSYRCDLLQFAEENDAPDVILDIIEGLPDVCFKSLDEVMDALHHIV